MERKRAEFPYSVLVTLTQPGVVPIRKIINYVGISCSMRFSSGSVTMLGCALWLEGGQY